MELTRRKLLLDIVKSGAGMAVGLPLINCSSDSSDGDGNQGHENQKYIPEVNEKPYFEKGYFLNIQTTDAIGAARFSVDEDSEFWVAFDDPLGGNTSGLEVTLYQNQENPFNRVALMSDPQKKYCPRIVVPNDTTGNYLTNGTQNGFYDVFDIFLKELIGIEFSPGKFIEEINQSLPGWTPENVPQIPGIIYHGDWSFNQLKSLNTTINKGSAILTLFPPATGAAANIYGVTSTIGEVLDVIDDVIDFIDPLVPYNLVQFKDTKFPIYSLGVDTPNIIALLGRQTNRTSEKMRYLLPLQPGNSWTYSFGMGMSVRGVENVNGRDLIVVENVSGLEEFLGFFGEELRYFGFKDPYSGDRIFLDPPAIIGDGNVDVGRNYSKVSSVISETEGKIGELEETFYCNSREDLVLANRTPYGNCFKLTENVVFHGENGTNSATAEHFYAKNVGQVRMIFEGHTLDLSSFSPKTGASYSKTNQITRIPHGISLIGRLLKKS